MPETVVIEAPELLTRRAPVKTSTWNADTREFEVVFATPNSAVERWDAEGAYIEILDVEGWRMREGAPIPFLDNHRRGSIDDQLGVVVSSETVGRTARARVRLSRHHPLAERMAGDLADNMRFGVSVGYQVERWQTDKDRSTGVRTKTATKWTVQEISAVPVPADRLASTRGAAMPSNTPPANQPEPPAPAPVIVPTPPADPAAVTNRAQVNGEIRSLGSATSATVETINDLIDRQASIDEARRVFMDHIVQRSASGPAATPSLQVGRDHSGPDAIRSAMTDALAHRLAPHRFKLEGRAQEYRSHRILDMAGELAHSRGARLNIRNHEDVLSLVMRSGEHTTSDFPGLVADASNKVLLANYQAAIPTYRSWAARRNFNNWQPHNFLRIGDFPKFRKLNESGEVQYGTIPENREKVTPDEYGSAIKLSRRLLMSDDLGALGDFTALAANRAANDENVLVYSLLTGAPLMSDGKALFHADHGNLANPAAPLSIASVSAAVAGLRKLKGLGDMVLNLAPRYLVVGPDNELPARQILAAVTATKAADINPWSGSMEPVIDANITGNAWYIGTEPEAAPSIVYGYVNGAEGPQIRTEIDFETRGLKVAAGLDFGAGAIDFRGLYKNAGA